MNKSQLQNEILAIIRTVYDDKKALEKIHRFLMSEIYEDQQPEEIPREFKDMVSQIADSLLAGLLCYLNPDTFEVEEIPELTVIDSKEYELMTG